MIDVERTGFDEKDGGEREEEGRLIAGDEMKRGGNDGLNAVDVMGRGVKSGLSVVDEVKRGGKTGLIAGDEMGKGENEDDMNKKGMPHASRCV
jgi:hypothetical protein